MNRSVRIAASALAAAVLVACGSTNQQPDHTELQLPQFKLGDVVRVQAQDDGLLDVILTDLQKDPEMQAKVASRQPDVALVSPMPEGTELWRVHLEAREVSGSPKVYGGEPRLQTAEGTVIESATLVESQGTAFSAANMLDGQVIKGFRWYIVPVDETPAKFVWIRNGVQKVPLAEWPL
jgi:hypothetical protein